MNNSDSIATISAALLKAQMAMSAAAKSATNPHFKSKYSDLATIIEAVKGPLNAAGIVFMQSASNDSTGVQVTTRLQHESGEFFAETMYLPVPQQTPQAYGSAITYGKRYQLQAMTGLPSEDDDGQAASAPKVLPRAIPANVEGQDALADMSPEEQDFLRTHVAKVKELFSTPGGNMAAYLAEQHFDTEERLAMWTLLPSDVRSAIKRQQASQRAKETA